ncbi:hypothetical protein BN3662_01084 [Clostridiales bacterium CHKCI006]|nr:hypothetical protein BN3662_01084 [Clostridiales bacterium CHKCI006]
MIISINPMPSLKEFQLLMENTDIFLNNDASNRPQYYKKRSGSPLEDDVVKALNHCAKGTPFENSIIKVSGQKFPDIVAAKYYGVEVKSTKENHWTSTGSSIMETTRLSDVERIYMTFGKLGGDPVEFKSRPYEECLYGIAVTHMPRYLIDMRLKKGETIFDKIGIKYDELRQMDNPIAPVSRYYRSKLKPGESLWWTGDSADESVSATIRLWKNIPKEEKKRYTIYGCASFPEIFGGNYDRYALWLTSQGIVDPHIRDQFSAGGQEKMTMPNGSVIKLPAVYRRVKNNIDYFIYVIVQQNNLNSNDLSYIDSKKLNNKIIAWCNAVSLESPIEYSTSMDALCMLFFNKSYLDIISSLNQ